PRSPDEHVRDPDPVVVQVVPRGPEHELVRSAATHPVLPGHLMFEVHFFQNVGPSSGSALAVPELASTPAQADHEGTGEHGDSAECSSSA
ncbi:MAG TPA: hypothetical protein VK735_15975, partial [Pseudonocardia sp.]|uniref:hypothetical protein n=1 Tax=Pseudonocardia sp. TaxID=60912 RepID=UPI002B9C897C